MSAIGTFFDKIGSTLKKLFGSTTWEKQVQGVITYVAPIVETIIGLMDPAVAPLVSGIIGTVEADLATVSTVVSGATVPAGSTSAAAVASALNSVKTNLASLLAMAEVKNSSTSAGVTAAVNLIVNEMDAALTNLPSTTTAGTAPAAA
jgi:hypothetical protein